MGFHSDSCKFPREHKAEKTLNGTSPRQVKQSQKLGSILKLGKETHGDFHPGVVKNMDKFSPGSRKFHQKHIEMNRNKSEELVKYMSNLPGYLEKGKKPQEKAFNIGVLDWGLLENWQHNNYNNIMHISGKHSHSRNNSSSFMSEGSSSSSSSHFNRDNSSSTTESSSNGTDPFARNGEDVLDCKKSSIRSVLQGVRPVTQSSSLENVKAIKECKIKESGLSRYPGKRSKSFQFDEITSGLQGICAEHKCSSEMKKMTPLPGSVSVSPSRKNMEDKTYCGVMPRKLVEDEVLQLKMDVKEYTKVRYASPNRRFSFGLGKTGKTSSSTVTSDEKFLVSEKVHESYVTPNSGNSTCERSSSTSRGRSSPLRRLLDPLLKPKGCVESNQFDKTLKSIKFTGNHGKSTIQALLQVAVKNGLPRFTFTVENYSNILAATINESTLAKKGWIYTFFSFSEMQKKNATWMNKGSKDRQHTYISNVVAQMRVCAIKSNIREFVLTSDSLQNDELAAMILKFPENVSDDVNQDVMNETGKDVTVILAGGDHGVPRKGDPSPLIERWKTGGLCDCGGWDLGCRIRVLTNSCRSNQKSNSDKSESTFKLFSQDEVDEIKPFFTLSPFEGGIFSVEFNSSLQLIQAFSIGIAVMSGNTMDFLSPDMATEDNANNKEKISAQSAVEVSAEYASYPPLSPFARARIATFHE